MEGQGRLAERFEDHRGSLRAVAYRMLGSLSEAEDAVQEAWLRLSRADTRELENLGGWLTAVVARVCLDMLRSRASRREEPLAAPGDEAIAHGADPEIRGARAVAEGTRTFAHLARLARPALVDGAPGPVLAPLGRLRLVLTFAIAGERIVEIDVIADPGRLRRLDLAVPVR
jgi:DNA-directed RNA polymerase specialized sigma24 family protein